MVDLLLAAQLTEGIEIREAEHHGFGYLQCLISHTKRRHANLSYSLASFHGLSLNGFTTLSNHAFNGDTAQCDVCEDGNEERSGNSVEWALWILFGKLSRRYWKLAAWLRKEQLQAGWTYATVYDYPVQCQRQFYLPTKSRRD